MGGGAGAQVARGRSLPSSPDAQVVVLSNEIDSWMAMPEQSLGNMPYHLHQVGSWGVLRCVSSFGYV